MGNKSQKIKKRINEASLTFDRELQKDNKRNSKEKLGNK